MRGSPRPQLGDGSAEGQLLRRRSSRLLQRVAEVGAHVETASHSKRPAARRSRSLELGFEGMCAGAEPSADHAQRRPSNSPQLAPAAHDQWRACCCSMQEKALDQAAAGESKDGAGGYDINGDGVVDGADVGEAAAEAEDIWPLQLLDLGDSEQMDAVYRLLRMVPEMVQWYTFAPPPPRKKLICTHLVHYCMKDREHEKPRIEAAGKFDVRFRGAVGGPAGRYLNHFIFPSTMEMQGQRLSMSGQALGGELLFGARLGFSGTPDELSWASCCFVWSKTCGDFHF